MESHFFHGLGENLWRGTSPFQTPTSSPTYMTAHAVQEPQPIKRLPISPPSIVILLVLTSSSQLPSKCRDMEPDGCWTGSRDWQTDHTCHRGQQRDISADIAHLWPLWTNNVLNNNNVPAPVHCPSTGKCGLLPQHVHCHRLITHCSHFLLNFQLPTGFVLVG